jgi:hypothetical protein
MDVNEQSSERDHAVPTERDHAVPIEVRLTRLYNIRIREILLYLLQIMDKPNVVST